MKLCQAGYWDCCQHVNAKYLKHSKWQLQIGHDCFYRKMARKCLATTFKVNALTIIDVPAMILFSNLQGVKSVIDIDESGMIYGTFLLPILY